MDAVILAAGQGDRLAGYVPAFYKPLLVVEGAPLIRRIRAALEPVVTGRLVVVAAPQNAAAIVEVMTENPWPTDRAPWADHVRIVVQPTPTGPGHALALAAELCAHERVMIVCGDNLVHTEDVARVGACDAPLAVGMRRIGDVREAARYTLFAPDGTAVEPANVEEAEGGQWADGFWRAWLGPVCAGRSWLQGQRRWPTIGKRLSGATLVEVDCRDIGTPLDLP